MDEDTRPASSKRAIVTGRVQGVGFRWSTQNQARDLGIRGWVRNRMQGDVEVHIEGDEGQVDAMLSWLKQGPTMSRVDGVQVMDVETESAVGFEVRR